MAVIINDFEIAVEAPPPPAPGGVGEEEDAPPAEPATPERIVAVLRWHEERRSRVDAT